MRSHKWTPEQRKKFIATMAARRRSKGGNNSQHDAIIYLRHARKEIMKQMREGNDLDSSQLYALLALKALQED